MKLNGNWNLYYYPCYEKEIKTVDELKSSGLEPISATVPGNVELDLSRAGVLPEDLFKGMNILQAEKYETYEWWYEREFIPTEKPTENEKAVLHFGAVDCYADYFLNGVKIGESENMFLENEFDVTDKLKYGEKNTLHVHIYSAVVKSSEYKVEPNTLAYTWGASKESVNTRKAPHSYGWDIMPRAVSAGIWRDVELKIESIYKFKYMYFATRNCGVNSAEIIFMYDAVLPKQLICRKLNCAVTVSCEDSKVTHKCRAKNSARIVFNIPSPKLWWPKHYGEAKLYDAHVELTDDSGNVIIEGDTRFGVRKLVLKHSDVVEEGGGFEFIVNGKRIMATGTNWVPMDAYHSRDKERYARALDMANDLGCNIIRCWGGNVYEDHEFFDYCDTHGIMVWQDFAMACHYYPQNDRFFKLIENEAISVIEKLRQHPSIVLWSGDNEIDSMLAITEHVNPEVNRITREIIPRVVERLDPYRPYIASSPYISAKAFNGGDNRQGSKVYPEDHLWGPRDYFKSAFYKGSTAYFVSETGYHGCPSKASIEKFIDADKVWPYQNNEQWNLHSSDQDNRDHRTMLMHNQVKQLFGEVPTDMDDYVTASQLSQAEAKKFFIETMRSKMARNGGVIWWNLIDGWPQMSDAVVDYYYDKKLAYNFIKRSQAGFMIMVDELDNDRWGQKALCCNSTLSAVTGSYRIYDIDTDETLAAGEFYAAPNANTVLKKIPAMYSDKRMLIIEWTVDGKTSFNTFLSGAPGYDLARYKEWLKKIAELEEKYMY